MNIFVSRDGQTFGPYPVDQARQFLESGQLLANDYALVEGQTEWKTLNEVLANADSPVSSPPIGEKAGNPSLDISQVTQTQQSVGHKSAKPKVKDSNRGKKVHKIKGAKQVQTVYVAQKKGIVSKIISTIMVFTFLFILAVGGIVGAYFAMPEKIGPMLKKFGLPVDEILSGAGNSLVSEKKITTQEPRSTDEIKLDDASGQAIVNSGIHISDVDEGKGIRVVSSVDPENAMEDKDLAVLLPIAFDVVSLDLTNSKITDQGISSIVKLSNLKKLILEGSSGITANGIKNLKDLSRLEYLNLIHIKLDDSLIDVLIEMESLRQVYLFQTELSEEAISRFKTARPQVFVNAG